MLSALSTENLATMSLTHPWRVIIAWVIVFLVAGGLAGTLFMDSVTTEIKFLNTPESDRAQDFLEDRGLRGPIAVTDVLMVRSADTTVDDEAYRQAVEDLVGRITALGAEVVADAPTYYMTEDDSQVSADRRSTIVPIVLAGGTAHAAENVAEVHEAIEAASMPAGFEVFITGKAILDHELTVGAEKDLVRGEMIGIPIALVILAVVFGAVVAAVVPIILAIVVAIGLVAVIGQGI